MTNKQKKLRRPAGELSPTELTEHKKFDAVRTHSCTGCGKVFEVENLKCPDCSTLIIGNEVGAWSNFSHRKKPDSLSSVSGDSPSAARPKQKRMVPGTGRVSVVAAQPMSLSMKQWVYASAISIAIAAAGWAILRLTFLLFPAHR